MVIIRQKNYSIKYNPITKKYEGKVDWKDRAKSAAALGTTGAGVGALLGSVVGKPGKGALIGAGIGTGLSTYLTRQSQFDKYNKELDQKNKKWRKEDFDRRTRNLPISYAEFQKRFPNQYKQLKDLGKLGYYSDENPGDIEWFERGGLEKGRYLPISDRDEYDSLMFDIKTGKFVDIDSEVLEPCHVKSIKSWVKYGY